MLKQIFILTLFLGGTLVTFSCGNKPVSAPETKIDIAKEEQELIRIDQKIMKLRSEFSDSLDYYSHLFSTQLENLLSHEETLTYSFKALTKENACDVTTSKDGLFRIYSWDSNLGGTMHFFNVIYQYRSGKTVKTQRYQSDFEGDPVWYCSDIFTLKTKTNTFYLAITNGIYSSRDVGQSIRAFELTEQGLNDSIPLMKTAEGMQNSLDVHYDFFSAVDRPERPIRAIQYNPKTKLIQVACVNDKEEILFNCNDGYQFNGKFFEHKGRIMR